MSETVSGGGREPAGGAQSGGGGGAGAGRAGSGGGVSSGGGPAGFATFLQLERTVRHAPTPEAVRFSIVNETRRLVVYRQAVLAGWRRGQAPVIEAVSSVAVIDRSAPYLQWLERVMAHLVSGVASSGEGTGGTSVGTGGAGGGGGTGKAASSGGVDIGPGSGPGVVDPEALPEALRRGWIEWGAPAVLWCPLSFPAGEPVGGLWLARERPWQPAERVLVEQLCDAYAHALAMGPRRRLRGRRWPAWLRTLAVTVLAGAVLAWPVAQTALAPAEIVARAPFVVASPLDGVVRSFHVQPNQPVAAGQPLFSLDDTDLRSRLQVAERALGIAEAEYRSAAQGAFQDRRSTAQLSSLEAQVELRRAERDYARAMLARLEVSAPRPGLALYSDPQDWIGRPVRTGERIIEIADPEAVEVRIWLPVKALIPFVPGAAVTVFPDIDPLAPLAATVVRINYEAEITAAEVLAYRVVARLEPRPDRPLPRIGWQGTASITGELVPLAFSLFRRPLSAVRQAVGM